MDKETFKSGVEKNYKAYRGSGGVNPSRLTKDNIYEIRQPQLSYARLPSGSIILDHYMKGGYPRGIILELVSQEGVGKSTSLLTTARSCLTILKENFIYLDYESALSFELIEQMKIPYIFSGRDDDDNPCFYYINYNEEGYVITESFEKIEEVAKKLALWVYQPDTYEEGEALLNLLVPLVKPCGIVIDSLPHMWPSKVLNSAVDESNPGVIGMYNSLFFGKQSKWAAKFNYTVFIINQLRVDWGTSWGPKQWKSFSDGTIKFTNGLRIELKKGKPVTTTYFDKLKNTAVELVDSHEIYFKPKKFKQFLGQECVYHLKYGVGIDNVRAIVGIMLDNGAIIAKGTWLSFSSELIEFGGGDFSEKTQGLDNITEFIRSKNLFNICYSFLVSKGILEDYNSVWFPPTQDDKGKKPKGKKASSVANIAVKEKTEEKEIEPTDEKAESVIEEGISKDSESSEIKKDNDDNITDEVKKSLESASSVDVLDNLSKKKRGRRKKSE